MILLKPILIFKKNFSPIFEQLPIFDWPTDTDIQNLLTDIFADVLAKYFS